MKVAIYARVSTRDKGQNPEIQLVPCRRYAVAMEWEVYQEYVDKARATDFVGRKAWAELMKAAATHQFDILLVWKLDRAFRDVQHCRNVIDQLTNYHIGFRSYTDTSIDTTSPSGKLMLNILASMAEFEKDLDSERIREGMDYAQEHGTKSGKPIGRGRVKIEDDEIWELAKETGGNRSQVARVLTERHGRHVSPGFVSLRLKRGLQKAGQKEGVLQG